MNEPLIDTIDEFEFHQTLEQTPGTAIVFFSSRECSSCRYWEQLLVRYRQSHPGIHLFKVDAGENQALAQEFSLFHLPALFLYLNGEFYSELQCHASPEALERAITEALAAPPQEMP